ncbi:hypothetical protein ACFL0P_00280 [Candidatus Omnitrophota bacterium]
MKKIIFPIFLILALFLFLFFKSKAFLVYKVIEARKGVRHTSIRYVLDWDVFLNYVRDIPRDIFKKPIFNKTDSPYNLGLSGKEIEGVKKVLMDMKAATAASDETDIDVNKLNLQEKIRHFLENYKGPSGPLSENYKEE